MKTSVRAAKREAIWAAFQLRIASGERDPDAGYAAWRLYNLLSGVCIGVLFMLPGGLFLLAEKYLGPIKLVEIVVTPWLIWFQALVFWPVQYDVVWRMDITGRTGAFVRPDDVFRTFELWLSPTGKDLPFLRRLFRHV